MSKKLTIYLSGPMTGLPDFNYPAFNVIAKELRDDGHIVYNPAEIKFHGEFNPRQAFAEYTQFICVRADAIAMLPGWEKSKGALIEKNLAEYCGLQVIYV